MKEFHLVLNSFSIVQQFDIYLDHKVHLEIQCQKNNWSVLYNSALLHLP